MVGSASNLWSWHRAQAIVSPRKTEPTVPVTSVSSDWRRTSGSMLPATTSRGPHRPKPVAIKAEVSPGSSSSPAIWRATKRS